MQACRKDTTDRGISVPAAAHSAVRREVVRRKHERVSVSSMSRYMLPNRAIDGDTLQAALRALARARHRGR